MCVRACVFLSAHTCVYVCARVHVYFCTDVRVIIVYVCVYKYVHA